MGGRCIDQLAQQVTHLVTESVRTKKYEVKYTMLLTLGQQIVNLILLPDRCD